MKIQIIGYSGAGKSTLATKLGELYDIPVLHLDNLHWYGQWQEHTDDDMTAQLETFLNEQESWVIDGNYFRIAPQRFTMSDITVFLDFGKCSCFLAAWHRYRQNKGKPRESCPCPEKFDRDFRRWLWHDGRTQKRKLRYRDHLAKATGLKVVLKNRRQVNAFLKDLTATIKKEEQP